MQISFRKNLYKILIHSDANKIIYSIAFVSLYFKLASHAHLYKNAVVETIHFECIDYHCCLHNLLFFEWLGWLQKYCIDTTFYGFHSFNGFYRMASTGFCSDKCFYLGFLFHPAISFISSDHNRRRAHA